MNTGHPRFTLPHPSGRAAQMRSGGRSLLWSAALLAGLMTFGWLGLQVQPQPFPAYPPAVGTPETVPLPAGLPAPALRFYRQTYGERLRRAPEKDGLWTRGRTGDLRLSGG